MLDCVPCGQAEEAAGPAWGAFSGGRHSDIEGQGWATGVHRVKDPREHGVQCLATVQMGELMHREGEQAVHPVI